MSRQHHAAVLLIKMIHFNESSGLQLKGGNKNSQVSCLGLGPGLGLHLQV